MDSVHDTLADGRPFRVLMVVATWSRQRPVQEAGLRMSGATVGEALGRVLNGDRGPRSITGPNSNLGRWKIGPIHGVCNSTSFDQENRWKTSSLNRLQGDCELIAGTCINSRRSQRRKPLSKPGAWTTISVGFTARLAI